MNYELLIGDCRQRLTDLASGSVQTCITSPPYFGLRDYGHDEQIGSEPTPDAFVAELVNVFREVRRVLADDGTAWLNLGDSYANDTKWGGYTGGKHATGLHGGTSIGRSRTGTGLPSKSLIGIPWRVAFALQADGWVLRNEIIWHKPDVMPENVSDRCTRDHEHLFLFSKQPQYFYNADAIREPLAPGELDKKRPPRGKTNAGFANGVYHSTESMASHHAPMVSNPLGRNKRTVWKVSTSSYSEGHFATFPPALILPCVLAGSRPGDTVLDPFNGAGTTGLVALENGRRYVGIELNSEYAALTRKRLARVQMDMFRSMPVAL